MTAFFPMLVAVVLATGPDTRPATPSALDTLRAEARALQPLVQSPWVRQFLLATADLPDIAPRLVYKDETAKTWYSAAQFDRLAPAQREALVPRELDETYYYNTKYGTPLAYARALDLLAAQGLDRVAGRHILDFGYGTIGHLRLLASLGADCVGVDVDPLLPALYSAGGDQGTIRGAVATGRITLVHGRFPDISARVGGGYDVILSKNTLKNGFFHPARSVDKRMLIDLGVEEDVFIRTLHRLLKPGGLLLIYNICPAPAPPDKPYIPWADGRCPFSRSALESAGFRVIEFDRKDDAQVRAMGRALGWDKGDSPMKLDTDLFATYTLLVRP